MKRFILKFKDNTEVSLNTMKQVKGFIKRAEVDEVTIYECKVFATRDGWNFKETPARVKSTAPNTFKRWSNAEHRKLISLRRAGLTTNKIADELGRSYAAIQNRLSAFSVSK